MPENTYGIMLEGENPKFGIIDELKLLDLVVGRAMNTEFAGNEVTFTQAGVLLFLAKRQGKATTHRAIEEHFGISNPAVSTMVKRLEAKGLATVAVDENDKRSRCVTITNAGLATLSKADQKVASVEGALLRGMSDEEKKQALALMKKMRHNLDLKIDEERN